MKNLNYLDGPFVEISVRWNRTAKILLKFLENVDETRRHLNPLGHGEGQTHCLTRTVIRILKTFSRSRKDQQTKLQNATYKLLTVLMFNS